MNVKQKSGLVLKPPRYISTNTKNLLKILIDLYLKRRRFLSKPHYTVVMQLLILQIDQPY